MPDPFDLESLCISQDFVETVGVKKLLKTVPARKPNPQDFVRVHPDPSYRRNIMCVDLKDDREHFLVRPEIAPELIGETVTRTIFTAINRQGVVFLWPVPVASPDGKQLEWWRSMREAAELAMTRWLRIKANMSLGAYEIFEAEGVMSEPEWPDLPFQELLRIAFRDRMITTLDVEAAADAADVMLNEMRATDDIDRRREIMRERGRSVGRFVNAINAVVSLGDIREVHQAWADKQAGHLMAEVLHLCGMEIPAEAEAGDGRS
jgi:hypothetical protein